MKTDKEILDWLEENPQENFNKTNGYWRRVFGYKDFRNQFGSFREAVACAIDDPKLEGKSLDWNWP